MTINRDAADRFNMGHREEVFIHCGTIVLEGIFELPEKVQSSVPGAVICHPHPLYGGNMYNNVVRALRKAFLDRGVATLRFNFRGTGRSEGSHGNGTAELEDVRAAVDFMEKADRVNVHHLVIAGYSFGCWVGFHAAFRDPRPSLLVGISPPVNMYDFSFLKDEARPTFLVAGDRDFVCDRRAFEELVDGIPEPKRGLVLPGVDHFHVGNEERLSEEVGLFLETFPFS